jgi:hypothetical protein
MMTLLTNVYSLGMNGYLDLELIGRVPFVPLLMVRRECTHASLGGSVQLQSDLLKWCGPSTLRRRRRKGFRIR